MTKLNLDIFGSLSYSIEDLLAYQKGTAMTTYLHHHLFDVILLAITLGLISLVAIIWVNCDNYFARRQLREEVVDLVQRVVPDCEVERKRRSSKHVRFFVTIRGSAIRWVLYFDGGRHRFELDNRETAKVVARGTLNRDLVLTEDSLRDWLYARI